MNKIYKYFLHKINFLGLSLPLLILFSCKSEQINKPENSKPNIVLFVADDLGWNDVGFHGSEIRTPNIDKLAETGVELNQFYVYPTCSPTRASLLTGKYASRFGIGGPIAMKSTQVLPTDVKTLPGILRTNGYETAITGKWHLGLRLENGPKYYGFDYTYGYLHGQIDQYTHKYKNGDRTWHRNGEFIEEEGHATDLITKEAIKYISEIRDKEKPFLLYVPYSVPHYPLQEENKWIEPYKNLNNVESRKVYAASAEHMDYSIGKIIKSIESEGEINNTIIIFISDNGGQENWDPQKETAVNLYEGRHGPYPKLGDNSPLKGYKTDLFDGGIRVPAIINWNGKLNKSKIEHLIKITDLFPTLVSTVGITLPNINFDGNNVWDIISGNDNKDNHRQLYLRTSDKFTLIKGDWKLLHFGKTILEGYNELYNIKSDPYETKNVITDFPDKKNELLNLLKIEIKEDSIQLNK
ncbi:MAG: arylsulfatase [Ignavibacteriales bacterium]|nr:arylsulfatase [Ignavibacteriales bacterium]